MSIFWLGIPEVMTIEEVKKRFPKQVSQMGSQIFRNGHSETIYTPDSFDITVDMDHPAPGYFVKSY